MLDVFNPFSLEGKTILVTGASSGIGQAIAVACSKMGATIIATGRNEGRLNATISLMANANCHAIPADLTNSDDLKNLVNALPKLDGIVHCAGVGSRVPCKSLTQEAIDEVLKPNLEAPMLLQAEILSQKKLNKESSIVLLASRASSSPSMGNAVYSASKGAIISYAKCLALELAPRQIRVNCICPGMVWTSLITKDVEEEHLKEEQLKYPLKRFGTPDDVAYLAVYLLSNASSWMTGSAIDISGGGEGVLA